MGNDREFFKHVLDNSQFLAGFTNRNAGNFSLHVGDDPLIVQQNRQNLCKILNLKELKFMNQIHSNIVKIVNNSYDEIGECDSLITYLKDIGLCVMTADCAPILLIDKALSVVSAIHSGMAGVINKITSKTFDIMQGEFGSKSGDIIAFVGPNIKVSCYEIDDMDLGDFNKFKNGKNFDINSALKDEFNKIGIKNVNFSEVCTHCNEKYFSYRKERDTGRFVGVVAIKSLI